MLFNKDELENAKALAWKERPKYEDIVSQIERLMPGAKVERLSSQKMLTRPTLTEPLTVVETYTTKKNGYVVKREGVEVFRASSQKAILRLVVAQAKKWINETDFITLDEERAAVSPDPK